MSSLKRNVLYIIVVLVLKYNTVAKADDLEIQDAVCEKKTAVTVQCFNDRTQSITNGGTYRRHERMMVKLDQIEGACSFQIPEYRLAIYGPLNTEASKDACNKDNRSSSVADVTNACEAIPGFKREDTFVLATFDEITSFLGQKFKFSFCIYGYLELDDSVEAAMKGVKYTESHFEIRPYAMAHIGATILKFFPMSDSRTKAADPVRCTFNVDYSNAKAVILGGKENKYKPDQLTTIDASYSTNMNEHIHKTDNLGYRWECEVLKGKDSKFCTDKNLPEFAGKNKLIIPASESKTDYIYKVSVIVQVLKTKDPEKYQDIASQIVKFSDLAAVLKIQCVKNCAPKSERTLTSATVILKAQCINCETFISNVYFYWTIEDSKQSHFDYTKLRDPSRKGDTCYIKADALTSNEVYTVKVETKGEGVISLSSEFRLDTKLPPPLKDCSIDPPSGTAFQTGFQAKCTYFPGDNTFEVFSMKDGKASLLVKTTKLESQVFYLPTGVSVVINMTENKSGYTQTATANVEVKEMLNLADKTSDKEIGNAVGAKMDDVLDLSRSGEPALALQGLAAVVGEYSNMPADKKHLELDMDHKAINSITSINIDSPEQAKQAVDILSQITEKYQDNPDPELSLKSSAICDKASKILSAEAHKIENPALMRLQLTNNLKSLASCSQAGLGQNIKAVQDIPIHVVVPTTDFPLIDNKKIPEQYDDYTDDIKASENMARFEKASKRMKDICFSNAKMIVLTMIPEEDPVVNVQGSMSILSVRRYCEDIPKTNVGDQTVMLHPSTDCKHSPVVDIMMCIVDKNPYWWKDNTPMITKVVYAKFDRSKYKEKIEHSKLDEDPPESIDELQNFLDPFTLTFKKNENMTTQLDIHQAVTPTKSISEMDEDTFYEEVSTNRIYVFKNRGFTVTFKNMTTKDYYDIVLTEFEKPTYTYFKDHYKTMSIQNNMVYVDEIRSYDTFWFLSILSNKKTNNLNSTNSNYFFSVTTMACYTWNETVKEWVFACNASIGTSTGTITCYCTTGEIFTGHVLNNNVNFVENIVIHFRIDVQRCWIIFITTSVTFFLFCLLLLFASFEKKYDILDRVFFVGDVPSYFQYAYIIVVKTGKKRQSGTTSNVTIKMYGTTSDTLEHVLNYPDPELIMLQRNMDTWFVIATENLLGDVKKIELWFDSVGNNTKWYGSKIEVYDIQQNKSWEFKLENWFDVTMDEHNVFVITPEEKKPFHDSTEKTKKETIIKAIKMFQGKTGDEVNLWNLSMADPLLMFKERVLIIFSTLMTMFLVIMVLYNIPSFNESDSIDENTFGFNSKLIWTPILGATGVFLFHFPLVYLIKRAKFRNIKEKDKGKVELLDNTEKVTYICWVGTIVLLTISATALICYGFWVPMDSSLLWLISVILGIFFNMSVLQNISCILYAYRLRLPAHVESFAETTERIIQYVELQRAWLYKRFGALSLRPYLQHLYYHLDLVTLKERMKLENLKMQTVQILEDLIMIVIYVSLLYVVLMLDKEPMAVYSHQAINNLVTGKLVGTKMEAKTVSDVEEYINQTLLPSIQSLQWYGKFVQDNPGMSKDFSNRYLGIIRIRQHRTKEVPCVVPKVMEFLNMTCRQDYSKEEEFGDFSRKWEVPSELMNLTAERMASSWKYSNSTLTGTSAYFGELTIYPGGGYVTTLGRTLKNSFINLKYLRNYTWVDLRTRAIIIEFLTYNPNVNLFNTVEVVFEISAAGSIESKIEIQTRKLLMVDNDQIFTKKIVNVCFVVILVVLSVRIIHKFIKGGRQFFYNIWSLFDIGIVILSIVSIYLYYARLRRIKIYVNDLTKTPNNQFVNYFHLFTADNILTTLTATLVFISTFRLWKLLRFMIIIQTAEKTLKDAAVPLLVCLVYQSVYIIAFSICGMLFFGSNSKDFMNFHTSFTTLILLSINLCPDFNMDHIIAHPLGVPYYILYALLSLFFTTLYVSIITMYYGDAKDFYSDETGFVSKFIEEKWTYYTSLIKIKIKHLRGGNGSQSDDKIIKPKLGDRYEDCMTIPKSRIRAMALISMCVLWNEEQHKKMTEKDFEMMSKMIKELFGKESSEKDIFFITGDSQHIEFVDNWKLEKIADICERLVVESTNIIRVSRKAEQPFIEHRIQRINTLIENINTITRILDNVKIRA